jgi:O-antigen ligase
VKTYTPFPNPNQTGDLFALTAIAILACVQDDFRKRRKRWIAWILALGLIGTAIVLNSSWSGIGILVVGSAFWLSALAFRKRSRFALGSFFLFLLVTALVVFGEQTFQRFHLGNFGRAGISSDLRWRIFQDTFRLIRDSPWSGIGFGNFESIFAVFREASLSDPRALHPESDWLWLWTEVAWPAVVLTVLGIALLVSRVFPLQTGTDKRYRLAALIAALLSKC